MTVGKFGLPHLIDKLNEYGGSEELKDRVKELYEELYDMGYDTCRFERDDEFEWCLREACKAAYYKGYLDGHVLTEKQREDPK